MKPKTGKKHLKMILVGDTAVGKSALIRNYLMQEFSDDYEATVLDIYKGDKSLGVCDDRASKKVTRKLVHIEIHDTSGDPVNAEPRKI